MADSSLGADDRKSVYEVLGEFLREFALPILVFVPLEFFLQVHETYSWLVIAAFVVVSGGLLIGGIVIDGEEAG